MTEYKRLSQSEMNLLNIKLDDLMGQFKELENLKSVFGAPVKIEDRTVVPVASVKINGTGSGSGDGGGPSLKEIGKGGGGGEGEVEIEITPIGFIYEKDGVPTFVKIS